MLELRPFQRTGVEYILDYRRALVADQMGLGKTIQALAALRYASAFPALVICPAGLKLNWQREAAAWLPDATTTIVSGRTGDIPKADITIVNYDILTSRARQLQGMRAVILDESQHCKSYDAARTRAAVRIVQGVDLRIELTGTPVLNAPHELIPQLDILGVLDQFGGRKAFCDRYCPVWEMPIKVKRRGKEIEIKIEKHGARNLDELNHKLREVCMIRREKTDVLSELPAKTRATLWVPGSKSEMKVYRALEREDTTPAVKLTHLRQQLGLAKVRDALDWLRDHPDPVVVWAHHRSVAEELIRELRCPSIRGQMLVSERQTAVDAFQRGDASRIVCSIQAANTGYTLTAASNALFVEQAWTPATLEQAEDRLHRIGQRRAVVSWYMAVPDTMDEHVFRLLRRKAAVVDEVTRSIELELIRVLEAA